ncbi:MAG: hypothetical protein IJ523_10120 [Succinivibrionaceae bacterium]|nr:hypothetical protein [Succinivibrionaceae bacterium]
MKEKRRDGRLGIRAAMRRWKTGREWRMQAAAVSSPRERRGARMRFDLV